MSDSGAKILTKVMAVGMIGVIASMAMLLFTLRAASPARMVEEREVLSTLAFEACLKRGEVLECSWADDRLQGIRSGTGPERIPFRVEGTVSSSLLERIVRQGIRIRRPAAPPASGGPDRR